MKYLTWKAGVGGERGRTPSTETTEQNKSPLISASPEQVGLADVKELLSLPLSVILHTLKTEF